MLGAYLYNIQHSTFLLSSALAYRPPQPALARQDLALLITHYALRKFFSIAVAQAFNNARYGRVGVQGSSDKEERASLKVLS